MSQSRTFTIEARGERETVITRLFDAPPVLVFDAWTKPELVRRWLGPDDFTLETCEIELRVGGKYLYAGRSGRGARVRWGGVYREIVQGARLVMTEQFFEPAFPGEAVVSITFTAEGGGTLMTDITAYPNAQVRDSALQSGMERGVREGFDKMDGLLAGET